MNRNILPVQGTRILVPLDGSALSEAALAPAVALAAAANARLRLVMVHETLPPPLTREMATLHTRIELVTRKAARDYLRRHAERLKKEGLANVTRVLLTGEPGPAIEKHIGEWDADLVVMMTHGRGIVARAWLGSVADYVVRHVEIPVLLLRATKKPAVGPIASGGEVLVPLDGSPFGEAALEPAMALAKLLGAKLSLVQVLVPATVALSPSLQLAGGLDGRLVTASHEQARAYLEGMATRLEARGHRVRTETIVSIGVAGTLLEMSGRKRVRLIALATHGRAGVRRLLLGSVADKLVRGADCPVLVCRSPARKGKG